MKKLSKWRVFKEPDNSISFSDSEYWKKHGGKWTTLVDLEELRQKLEPVRELLHAGIGFKIYGHDLAELLNQFEEAFQ